MTQIYCCDKNSSTLKLYEAMFDDMQIEVVYFNTGAELLDALHQRSEKVDLILSGYFLNDMTGHELSQQVFTARFLIPMIIATSSHETSQPTQKNVKSYLYKTVNLDDIKQCIEETLQQHPICDEYFYSLWPCISCGKSLFLTEMAYFDVHSSVGECRICHENRKAPV